MTTTNDSLAAARATLNNGEWDSNGVNTITLPVGTARKLLEQLDWKRKPTGAGRKGNPPESAWYSPDGHGHYWSDSEAAQLALLAETL